MNKFIVSGRTTKDLVLEQTSKGLAFTAIVLANNYSFMKDGQRVEATNFFRIMVYGKQAESIVKYCGKGSLLLIESRIQNDNYEKDGQKVYKDTMVASRIEYLALKAPHGANPEDAPPPEFIYDPEQEVN